MRKAENSSVITGRVYQHTLEEKTSAKGVDYIRGNIDVATDDAGLNIVTVTYVYVAPTYPAKDGRPEKKNPNYEILQKIMNGKTIVLDGIENATKVKLTPSLAVNDFVNVKTNEMVSAKRLEGGFVNIVNAALPEKETDRNKFKADILIYKTNLVEADGEKIDKDYLVVSAYAFNYAGAALPIDFHVKSEGGIKYFESLEASNSNPIFTNVWGQIVSSTITTRTEVDASTIAFGEPEVKESTRTIREWVITGAISDNYEIGDEKDGITADEIKKALSDRELHLAEVKKNAEDYAASKNATANTTTSSVAAAGGFNF